MRASFTAGKLLMYLLCIHEYTFKYLDAAEKNALRDGAQGQGYEAFNGQPDTSFPKRSLSRAAGFQCQTNIAERSSLKLAAFNVQIFGAKKMATAGVPDILVKIILRYDVILIQEIRDASQTEIMKLLGLVNKASTRGYYHLSISPRLGRSSSKEQYAFMYRKDILSVKNFYVYDDGQESLGKDTFEREPYIVHFTSTFTFITDFVLVAIHTSPSQAPQEIDELVRVYDDVVKKLQIPDVIILGDLNAACSYMSDSDRLKNRLINDKRFHWLISDCVDTSIAGTHCAYDRFVVAGDSMLKSVIETSVGILEFDEHLGLNETMTLLVSDHYPIELQLYSRMIANTLIWKTAEYTFRVKNALNLNKRVILGLRKTFSRFDVRTIYNNKRAIHGVEFSQSVDNRKEGLAAILDIKQKACPVKVITPDQIDLAEAKMKGEWDNNNDTEMFASGNVRVVKMVCEFYPSSTCWVAIVMNYN
ncbi:deoxyribonuclease-1-like isoform X2 [Montipora capricornis]